MAKDRISSNRPSSCDIGPADTPFGDNFPGTSAGGRAGSSPDSGNKPGPGFDGTSSGVGRAGSSVSLVLRLEEGDGGSASSALATVKAAIITSESIISHFMRQDQTIAAHCRIYLQTARRGSAQRGSSFWKFIDSRNWLG
jgi:hypothetical protein